MIINLLLIALICYYFKRKYENLEIAQNEQAKVLYQLLQQNSSPKVMNLNDILKDSDKKSLSDLDSDPSDASDDSDSDSESDTDDEKELEKDSELNADKIKTINLINLDKNEVEMEEIQVEKVEEETKIVDEEDLEKDADKDNEKDYSKMSIKQLKEILSGKGIVPTKMKKNEMIDLIEKSSVTINAENE
jgi:hypothetical protein